MNVDRILKRLNKAENTYSGIVSNEESKLIDKIDFDFFIMYQPSDGFVLVDEENAGNASLDKCLEVISEKGKLTQKDYNSLRI